MNLLRRLDAFLFGMRTWQFVSMIVVVSWLRTGVWNMPNLLLSRQIADNPFVNPFTDQLSHYLLWNWFSPFLAWAIGASSPIAFGVLHLAFAFATTALFMALAIHRFPGPGGRISIILFSALPVSGTIYFWVGMDAVTVFLMLVCLAWPQRTWLVVVAATGLGMQHFEQGIVATGALFGLALLSRNDEEVTPYPMRFCLVLIAGVIAGKAILVGTFAWNDITVNSGRVHWISVLLYRLLSQFFLHAQYVLWSVFGVGWLAALRYLDWGRKSWPFFIVLGGLLLLLPFMDDQTRVIAIVAFPLVTACWLFNARFLESIATLEASFLFLLWAINPWAWVWRGIPRWSEFPYELVFLLQRVFGILEGMPMDPMLGPL